MTNKELYTEWVKTQDNLPLFMQPWWLDAVSAGKEWDVILVGNGEQSASNNQQSILAALPYMVCRKWWMRWIDMPRQTQINGLWLDEHTEFEAEQLSSICQVVMNQLAEKKLHYYYQQFPVGSPCPEFFKAAGFKVKERVTYRIDDLTDLDKIIDRFSKNKKRQLQKALSRHAERKMTAEEFYQFHLECLQKQNKKASYSREFLLVLEQKLRKHKQAQILTICNADHIPYAAALLVWDKQRMYYLIPCFDPDYKESGAGALLVLEAIKLAREKGVTFDFEGSMISGVAKHYKQFGPTEATYYSVEKYYKWWFRFALFWSWLRNRKYR